MNYLTKKRGIPGIVMLILGLYIAYCGINASIIGTKFGVERAVALGGDDIFLGIAGIIPGIVLICTHNKMPHRWIDYSIAIIAAICLIICLTEFPGFGAGLINWMIFIIILACLIYALPWSRNGYKNYHYPNNINSSYFSNNNNLEDIKKLKSLLDDGAITQDEYDKKKKQLLNL